MVSIRNLTTLKILEKESKMITIVPKEAYDKLNKEVTESEKTKTSFSFKNFQDNVLHYSMVNDYLKGKKVEYVGEGSGRIAFMLPKGACEDAPDSAVCLKVAKNVKGVAQNKGELKMSEKFGNEVCFPKVFAGDKRDGIALEMELGRKVELGEFNRFFSDWFEASTSFSTETKKAISTKINSLDELYKSLNRLRRIKKSGTVGKQVIKDTLLDLKKVSDKFKKYLPIVSLFEVLFEKDGIYEVKLGDFGEYDNWAFVNREGEDVLIPIDWGLTQEVAAQYYT